MTDTSGYRLALRTQALIFGTVCLSSARLWAAEPPSQPALPSATADWLKQIPNAQFQAGKDGFVLQYFEDPVARGRKNTQGRQRLEDRQPTVIETGDTLETGPMGRALVLRFTQAAALDENTKVAIETPEELRALQGQVYVKTFGPSPARPLWVLAAGGRARLATEFHLAIDPTNGTATVTLFSGQLLLPAGERDLRLTNRSERASITANGLVRQEVRASRDQLNNLIQWILHYPAVLDLGELEPLGGLNSPRWVESAAAYRQGNFPLAIQRYREAAAGPAAPATPTRAEQLYEAALLVGAGQIDQAQLRLQNLPPNSTDPLAKDRQDRIKGALLELVAAVKLQPFDTNNAPRLSAEWMARSYTCQSRSDLKAAREAARQAVLLSPNSGYAHARLGELQFGFGESNEAAQELRRALELSPANPQAFVVQGFIAAARGRQAEAAAAFAQAVNLDGRLGDAWLGMGLAEFRWGDPGLALHYLETAVAQEPQRAVLRSYLGKAYETAGYFNEAAKELDLAKEMDRFDPTGWLYSAILRQQRNQLNQAVKDLERSRELNDNRSAFRSRLLLDQDLSIRNANLAAIYADVGMEEVSVREATKALGNDYGNFSAHLFLANSYNALRDRGLVNLRYESVVFNEYLLANLLAPVGGTKLAPLISQQEYSSLFQRDHLGFSSLTGYRSDGLFSESAAQYGVFGDSAYAMEGDYRTFPNPGKGADLEQEVGSIQVKQQLTRDDSLYLQAIYDHVQEGDFRQVYDPIELSSTYRLKETQSPNVLLGYHHEWAPGSHTLFLLANINDHVSVDDSFGRAAFFQTGSGRLRSNPFSEDAESQFTLWSADLQQIWQTDRQSLICGARWQEGQIDTHSKLISQVPFPPIFSNPAEDRSTLTELQRMGVYSYYQPKLGADLTGIVGLSFDALRYPANVNIPPISSGQESTTEFGPKVGLLWTPHPAVLGRVAYSRNLGGFSLDNSVRLEPSQVAGFNQSFRSLAPDSLTGTVPGSEFDVVDLAMDFELRTHTYLGWQLEFLRSEGTQELGAFAWAPNTLNALPTQVRESVQYEEKSLTLYANQLLDRNWSIGSRYRLSSARLDQEVRGFASEELNQALLHELTGFILFNHESGFFGRVQTSFMAQHPERAPATVQPQSFWQVDAYAGYRFPRRHAEVLIGVANLTDRDYRLSPVTAYPDLPRSRSLVASLRVDF